MSHQLQINYKSKTFCKDKQQTFEPSEAISEIEVLSYVFVVVLGSRARGARCGAAEDIL